MDQLKRVPARAFVAVDASACNVAPTHGAFAYGPGCPRSAERSASARKFSTILGPSGVRIALRMELHAEPRQLPVLGGHHESVLGPRRQLELGGQVVAVTTRE